MPEPDPGEFALIDRIIDRLGESAAREILVPPGDDAAVWAAGDGTVVATTDALVEGTHWRPGTMSIADVGWRALASNVSDIAAMGATPEHALIAAVLPPSLSLDQLDAFIDGIAASCRCHGVRVAGGDIVRGSETAFAVTVLGHAPLQDGRARVLRRDSARPGDAVAVSGTPGAAAAGLALIEAGRDAEPPAALLLAAHRRPVGAGNARPRGGGGEHHLRDRRLRRAAPGPWPHRRALQLRHRNRVGRATPAPGRGPTAG